MIAGVVFAEANQQSGLYTYVINDDHTATITGYNWEGWFIKKEEEKTFTSMLGGKTTEIVTVSYPGTDIEVPSELDGYPVTTIAAEAFRYPDNWNRRMDGVALVHNIDQTQLTSIGDCAFMNACVAFNPKEETKIPGSVGETRYCSFPITLEKIGAYCFANVRRVEILARTTSASTSALGSFTRKYYFDDYIIIPSKAPITEIPSYAFYQSDLHFDIQAPITTIGDYAFSEIFQHSSPFTDYRRMNLLAQSTSRRQPYGTSRPSSPFPLPSGTG